MPDILDQFNVPDEQAAKTGVEFEHLGGAQDAKNVVQSNDAPDKIEWSSVQSWIDTIEDWFDESGRWLLWLSGIDAVGFEVSFGVEVTAGVVGVNLDPIGVTFLWITNADVDPSEQEGPDKDPMAGNPHTYVFSSFSVGGGSGAKVAGDVSVDLFHADRWGEHNLPSSWAGPTVSFDAEASLGKYAGVQVSGSRFASVDPSMSGPFGIPFDPSDAWTGVSLSAGLESGAGGELQVGVTLIGASESLVGHINNAVDYLDFSQDESEIEKQVDSAPKPDSPNLDTDDLPEIPEQGDFYYQ